MKKEKVILQNETGLHARPAGELAKLASTFKSDVNLTVNGKTISAKSILAIMSLGIKANAEIEIECNGEDEETALKLHKAIVKARLEGFRNNPVKANKIKRALYQLLNDDNEVERIYQIVVEQEEY